MKITKFSFIRPSIENVAINTIEIDSIDFYNFNLLVGKNASGKSTIIDCILSIAGIINIYNPKRGIQLGTYYLELKKEDGVTYNYEYGSNLVKPKTSDVYSLEMKEKLTKNGDFILMERENKTAKLWSEKENTGYVTFNPPELITVLHARRDEIEFPYIEDIINWAKSINSIKFGHLHSHSFLSKNSTEDMLKRFSMGDTSLTNKKEEDINDLIGRLSEDSIHQILTDFNSLNYNVEKLRIEKNESGKNHIYLKEKSILYEIFQSELSQGMFRTLFLLIYIHSILKDNDTSLIVIDDMGEGLDFDRASKLGKLLFNKMTESDVQFIATSNDSFLMDVIDIKCWNIIQRDGTHIKSFNYKNSKAKFDYFDKIGLDNFDLFSSNFLNK